MTGPHLTTRTHLGGLLHLPTKIHPLTLCPMQSNRSFSRWVQTRHRCQRFQACLLQRSPCQQLRFVSERLSHAVSLFFALPLPMCLAYNTDHPNTGRTSGVPPQSSQSRTLWEPPALDPRHRLQTATRQADRVLASLWKTLQKDRQVICECSTSARESKLCHHLLRPHSCFLW
jgi:hypothetical protein